MEIVHIVFQFIFVAAVSFIVFCVLASRFKFEATLEHKLTVDATVQVSDSFQWLLAKQIGASTKTQHAICVWMVKVCPHVLKPEIHREAFVAEMKRIARRTDGVALWGDDRAIGYFPEYYAEAKEGLFLRLEREHPGLVSGEWTMTVVGYPEEGDSAEVIIKACELANSVQEEGGIHVSRTLEQARLMDLQKEEQKEQTRLLDSLTGVLSSKNVGTSLQKYVANHRHAEAEVSMIYIDIDHLEQYNKHYGREAGDAILKSLAEYVSTQVREEDLVGRMEEDEFIICMQSSAEEALQVAKRLARGIKNLSYLYGGTSLRFTVSMGVAACPAHGKNGRQLFDAAEVALQVSKREGTNVCELFNFQMLREATAAKRKDVF